MDGVSGRDGIPHLGMFQNHLSMQAGAYQNATWVCAAAKAGEEEGVYQVSEMPPGGNPFRNVRPGSSIYS